MALGTNIEVSFSGISQTFRLKYDNIIYYFDNKSKNSIEKLMLTDKFTFHNISRLATMIFSMNSKLLIKCRHFEKGSFGWAILEQTLSNEFNTYEVQYKPTLEKM